MKSHLVFFQVAELDTSESELLEEYKKLVKERLDVAGAALVEAPSKVQEAVKIGESKYKEHDAKIASCAGQLKLKPCAQPDCLCSFGSLALRILSLKTAETQDDLQTIINVIAGGSTALKQLNSAVSTAMQEVLKAVKDCRQREKLRKKQEDSGSSRAARTCSFFCLNLRVRCFSTAAFQGSAFFKRTRLSFFEEAFFNHFPMNHPPSAPHKFCRKRTRNALPEKKPRRRRSRRTKRKRARRDSERARLIPCPSVWLLWRMTAARVGAAPWVLHDEASLKSALTCDAAAHGRFMMFSSQFESSAPAQKHGRAFLKIQDGTGTQVAQILTEMQGDSMAKMCKDGQQASERGQQPVCHGLGGSSSVAETPRFLLVLEGGLDMLIMPLQTYLSVCSNLGPATDWTAWDGLC